ncbi:hypothetical protein ASG22_06845 [Chryseobacterium sp. Leaf405]|uniref:hypothetical protein n=1 Tax=Chryseobacterium sp. Leaf405 TaxID=1736367 RepID=UPI0006F6C3EF|nr:hypothetical protein [Chryseobacterium sp. Leaf405]KQT23750.1 hypothetical protein ASG22_06845 [Chryseobacterium sp. Leaf405]
MNNKISFIIELLNSRKISVSQKEQIWHLSIKELQKLNLHEDQMKSEIQELRLQIKSVVKTAKNLRSLNSESYQIITKDNTLLNNLDLQSNSGISSKQKIHAPKTMVKFLYNFSIGEKFKWFTHNLEGLKPFNYKEYIENANQDYNIATGWNINNVTYHNVKNFIFNTGDSNKTNIYGKGNIQFSWRDVEKWCKEHPNEHPYNVDFEGYLFKDYITQFKHIIEFRTDDADLTFNIRIRKLIRGILGVDFKPEFTKSFNDVGHSVKLFCDINLLFGAIKQIVEWIQLNKVKSSQVKVDLEDHDEFYCLEIIHVNSYMSAISSDVKLLGLSGDFDKVRKMLFSVADWEIIAKLKNHEKMENCKIICLDENTTLSDNLLTPNVITISPYEVDYVKHRLKLYKTKNL